MTSSKSVTRPEYSLLAWIDIKGVRSPWGVDDANPFKKAGASRMRPPPELIAVADSAYSPVNTWMKPAKSARSMSLSGSNLNTLHCGPTGPFSGPV